MTGAPAFTRARNRTRCGREGFALVAVLWVVVTLGALALVARLTAADLVHAATNRRDIDRARWIAEGCAERARAALTRAVERARHEGPASEAWGGADRLIRQGSLLAGCELELRPAGTRLDANGAKPRTLARLFVATGASAAQADSLVDALLDWRDSDDDRRPFGAEAADYHRSGRRSPRNGDIADARELAAIRGFGAIAGIDTLLDAEGDRVSVNHAPAAVLAALPGLGPEAAARIIEARQRGEAVRELTGAAGFVGPGGQQSLLEHFAELAAVATTQPDAWIVTARAGVGTPPVTAAVELKLTRAGDRAAILRKRGWIQ